MTEKNRHQSETGSRWLDYVFYCMAILFILYQMWYIKTIPYVPALHTVVHLGFAAAVCSFAKLRKTDIFIFKKIYIFVIFLASIVCTVLFFLGYKTLAANPSYPPTWALICGVVMAIAVMILTRWAYGWLFPIFAVVAFVYVVYGKYFPGALRTGGASYTRAITLLAADITSPWGVYGSLLTTSSNYLFLFIVFGSALSAFGSMRFITEAGKIVASKLRSGPAALAVITSALMGSITGSTVANITVTGAFTIPMMKKAGYKPATAAAMEAAASNGGQFLPPVMGATVFVMASYTGLPYLSIAKATVISALIYYFALLMYAELSARKQNLQIAKFEIDKNTLIFDAPLFIGPLGLLLVLLTNGYSLMTVVFWTIIAVVALGLLSTLRKGVELNWRKVLEEMVDGVITGANVSILMAVIGIFVAAMEVTGLTLKLSVFFNTIAGDSLFLLLIFTMLVSLLLGCAVPTPAAYVICATVMSPSLVQHGVPVLAAHLFSMFFASLSHLTPPVGVGLLVACKLAGAKYLDGAIETWKAAFPSLIFPFIFVYSPAILLNYSSIGELIATTVGTCTLIFGIALVWNRYWKSRLSIVEIGLSAGAALLSAVYLFFIKNYLWIIFAAVLSIAAVLWNCKRPSLQADK